MGVLFGGSTSWILPRVWEREFEPRRTEESVGRSPVRRSASSEGPTTRSHTHHLGHDGKITKAVRGGMLRKFGEFAGSCLPCPAAHAYHQRLKRSPLCYFSLPRAAMQELDYGKKHLRLGHSSMG